MDDVTPGGVGGGLVGTLSAGDWASTLDGPGEGTAVIGDKTAAVDTPAAVADPVASVAPKTGDTPQAPADPANPAAAAPANDPDEAAWLEYLKGARENADKLGFKTPQEYEAAQEREAQLKKTDANWEKAQETQEEAIFNHYQKLVTDGKMDAETAQQLHDRDVQNVRTSYELARTKAEQQTIAFKNEIAAAENEFPLLKLDDGLGSVLVSSYAQAGLGKAQEIASMLNRLLTAAGEKAVAEHVAKQAATQQNAAPVLPTGSGAAPLPTKNTLSPGNWWDNLK